MLSWKEFRENRQFPFVVSHQRLRHGGDLLQSYQGFIAARVFLQVGIVENEWFVFRHHLFTRLEKAAVLDVVPGVRMW